ncbi:MAG: hypothetical protein Q8Q88_17720 [Phenylobacterium sp.]|uniref:hypothetical protein n=1 Tax=Phenylobacterium sp. TaxID=1871053 RepID=UPI0027371552|nr:hypothetical protein [Phenylobacterium sp.]MDP3748880.1 hypothetical protein [Phenylobacterium sp.]
MSGKTFDCTVEFQCWGTGAYFAKMTRNYRAGLDLSAGGVTALLVESQRGSSEPTVEAAEGVAADKQARKPADVIQGAP